MSLALGSRDLVSKNYSHKSQLEPLEFWKRKDVTKVYEIISCTVEWNREKVEKEVAKVHDTVRRIRVKI